MRRRVSSRLQEYPFLSKISFCSHAAEAILFVDLKETAKHDVIIPDYSKYSAFWSRMFGIHSMYSVSIERLFRNRNSVNRTHPKFFESTTLQFRKAKKRITAVKRKKTKLSDFKTRQYKTFNTRKNTMNES